MTAGSRLRVGLVEPDAELRMLLRQALERDGRFVVVGEAAGPDEAFDVLDLARPDLLVVDVDLPDGNGLAMLADLAQRSPGARCVAVLSAVRSERIRAACAELGADLWVDKGGDVASILDELASACDQAVVANR